MAWLWALAVGARHHRRGFLVTASGGKYSNNYAKVGVKWVICAIIMRGRVLLHAQRWLPKGVVVGRGGVPRPSALARVGLPCLLACGRRRPNGAREPPTGADRGQRAGGAGVLAWRRSPWKGGGRTPVILYGGPAWPRLYKWQLHLGGRGLQM